ncbi:hypothetical protein AVEN_256460-1 [Araneus ventricosus]|uniref:Uncharacterized protein n=1 Tax=Araneus ventricosus TaxID=182803 RepID=A0A4Y2GZS0_ARAVE|nr:hypothetical protein AVEN_256460-1 [Araneus ventricosus]
MPCDKKGAKLSSETVEKVTTFYYNDDNSRICPGKKYCISVASENERVLKQKRVILYNLKELYAAFKEQHKDLKIGQSKFCSLRPRECVTAGNKGIHSVCVCIYQNIKLVLHALHIRDYISLLKKLVYSTESEKCMVHRCDNCPSVKILKEESMLSNELEMINEISYKQWVKTDGAELKTIITSVDGFVENLVAKLSTLCTHHFFI